MFVPALLKKATIKFEMKERINLCGSPRKQVRLPRRQSSGREPRGTIFHQNRSGASSIRQGSRSSQAPPGSAWAFLAVGWDLYAWAWRKSLAAGVEPKLGRGTLAWCKGSNHHPRGRHSCRGSAVDLLEPNAPCLRVQSRRLHKPYPKA